MTCPPDLCPDEPLRLQAVRRLNLVESPLEERFERITRQVKRALGVDIAAISLVEADRQFFKTIQGLDCAGTSRDVSFCGHTIVLDDLMVVHDAREDERFRRNPLVTGDPGIVFYAAVPIHTADGHAVGSLCVIHRDTRAFSSEEEITLRDFAAWAESEVQAASASEVQAALMESVSVHRRQALVDPLTRMWNREGILRLTEKVVTGAATAAEGAALVMVDLDHFKGINDGFGHAAGDAVLRTVAKRMLAAVRETDVVGRLGGDEFLLVLTPCDSERGATQVVERVRTRLIDQPVSTKAGNIPVTASFGVRFVAAGSRHVVDDLIDTADRALYDSKKRGRNTVCEFARAV